MIHRIGSWWLWAFQTKKRQIRPKERCSPILNRYLDFLEQCFTMAINFRNVKCVATETTVDLWLLSFFMIYLLLISLTLISYWTFSGWVDRRGTGPRLWQIFINHSNLVVFFFEFLLFDFKITKLPIDFWSWLDCEAF